MSTRIESITDRSLFQNIFKNYFFSQKTYVHNSSGNIEVKFHEPFDGLIKLQFHIPVQEPKNCMAFTRNKSNVIFVYLKYCEKAADNTYLFNPTKFQVVTAERRDERIYIAKDNPDRPIIYISNFISDIMINSSLEAETDKIKRIREIIQYDHLNHYDYLKIYFSNQGTNDARMNYFLYNRNPIFIKDVNSLDCSESDELYYKNSIYNSDAYLLDHKKLKSEISVPILFSSKIPYGYLQVNKTSPFPITAIPQAIRIAAIIDELNRKSKIFNESDDKFLVSDVSKNGMGIVFNNRKYIRYYKKNSYASLDINLPYYKKASLLANMRHLEMMKDRNIHVGFEIREMDSMSKANYNNYLSSVV